MAVAAVIVKIMPDGPETDLKAIEHETIRRLEKHHAKNISFQIQDIAFGLKALNVKFAWPESQDTDVIENELSAISHVSSAQIEDYRRAFG